jgi:hypothetical protein
MSTDPTSDPAGRGNPPHPGAVCPPPDAEIRTIKPFEPIAPEKRRRGNT